MMHLHNADGYPLAQAFHNTTILTPTWIDIIKLPVACTILRTSLAYTVMGIDEPTHTHTDSTHTHTHTLNHSSRSLHPTHTHTQRQHTYTHSNNHSTRHHASNTHTHSHMQKNNTCALQLLSFYIFMRQDKSAALTQVYEFKAMRCQLALT